MSYDRRILIADDDNDIRSGVAELLEGLGLEILQAETGTEAMEIVRLRRIDLAVLDMHMPGHTGLEVLTLIREEELGVTCIFCSGHATDAVMDMARAEGASAVLKKPIQPLHLKSEVNRLLGLSA